MRTSAIITLRRIALVHVAVLFSGSALADQSLAREQSPRLTARRAGAVPTTGPQAWQPTAYDGFGRGAVSAPRLVRGAAILAEFAQQVHQFFYGEDPRADELPLNADPIFAPGAIR